jgi:hypothetical protein
VASELLSLHVNKLGVTVVVIAPAPVIVIFHHRHIFGTISTSTNSDHVNLLDVSNEHTKSVSYRIYTNAYYNLKVTYT